MSATLTRCVVQDNRTTGTGSDGGAIRAAVGASLNVVQSTLSGNFAADNGGAIYLIGASLLIGTIRVLRSSW